MRGVVGLSLLQVHRQAEKIWFTENEIGPNDIETNPGARVSKVLSHEVCLYRSEIMTPMTMRTHIQGGRQISRVMIEPEPKKVINVPTMLKRVANCDKKLMKKMIKVDMMRDGVE